MRSTVGAAGSAGDLGASGGIGYRYRNRSHEDWLERRRESTERILQALAAHKQLLSQYRARIRTLTSSRNVALAQAIEDGLRISAVATALGETVPRVRGIALSFEDRSPSATSRDEHIAVLTRFHEDLQAAAAAKAAVEERLAAIVICAHRLGFTDETHLASMAGLPLETVHASLRARRRPSRP